MLFFDKQQFSGRFWGISLGLLVISSPKTFAHRPDLRSSSSPLVSRYLVLCILTDDLLDWNMSFVHLNHPFRSKSLTAQQPKWDWQMCEKSRLAYKTPNQRKSISLPKTFQFISLTFKLGFSCCTSFFSLLMTLATVGFFDINWRELLKHNLSSLSMIYF